MLVPLLICTFLLPSDSAADVYVHVVPYIDSDAWSQDHVAALKEFLSWCEGHNIRVAVFHYNVCEETAPGITDLIREYAERGTISLVGLHSTSHALGGLPFSLQYWELEFNLRFLEDRVKNNVARVLSVPSWVFDVNTLYACDKLGVRVLVCGADITTLNPEHDPKWNRLDFVALHMLAGYFNVGGDRLYYVPALNYASDLMQAAKDRGATVRDILRSAVRSLLDNDIVTGAGDVHLTLWILIHPWELSDANVRREFEDFLSEVADGSFNFEYNNVKVTFELSNPRDVIDMVLSGKVKLIALPEPDYSNILHAMGYHHWWELIDRNQHQDGTDIVWEWRELVSRWQSLDPVLWDLTVIGAVDSIQKDLYRAVKYVWDEALLNDVLESWDPNAARNSLSKEREALDTVYREALKLHAELVSSIVRKYQSLEREIDRLERDLKDVSSKQRDLERRLESLSRELQDRRRAKCGLPVLPVLRRIPRARTASGRPTARSRSPVPHLETRATSRWRGS
ncbi:hypothetical protein [Methanopyrus sp.]